MNRPDAVVEPRLDHNILERIAELICGDDSTPYYRTAYQLEKFFNACGWTWVGEVEGGRRTWVIDRLQERAYDPRALRRLLIRLSDPREYLDDDSVRVVVLNELNRLLGIEGYQVIETGDGPDLVTRRRTSGRVDAEIMIDLNVNLADLVSEATFGAQLQKRLEEVKICRQHGAPLAAIIMLGSVLEGVLYDFALAQSDEGAVPKDHLQTLIDTAGVERWVAKDVVDYAHVLRGHRNLVHPKRQWADGYAPDDDVVRIAWNVVVAALNDLWTFKTSVTLPRELPE